MTTFVQTTGSFKQGAKTLPGEYYNSTAIFEEERENGSLRGNGIVSDAPSASPPPAITSSG